MSRGIAAASHRRYGAMDIAPDVAFVDANTKAELQELCNKVGKSIQLINNFIAKLEKDLRKIGTSTDSNSLRDNIQVTQLNCNDLVPQTVEDLKTIGEKSRGAEKETKLQIERLQAEIQTAVPRYVSLQMQIADKLRRHVLQQPVSPTEDPDELHLREQEAAYNQQQRQIQMELEFERGLLHDRMDSIKNVEVKILDVNVIMRTLADIVNAQAPMIDTIEQNTENTLAHIETANAELTKAANQVSRRRRTVFCLAFVGVVIVLIILVALLTK